MTTTLTLTHPGADIPAGTTDALLTNSQAFANGTTNATTGPRMTQWLKLATYGRFQHPMGLQIFDRDAAEAMVADFDSLLSRLKRTFGGVPVFIGHPDDSGYHNEPGHADTRAYGWIRAMEARTDGLYIEVRWSDAGASLVANAHYKFLSPRWQMAEVGAATFRPVRLLSVGLTNSPNIPGDVIANARKAMTPTPGNISEAESTPETETRGDAFTGDNTNDGEHEREHGSRRCRAGARRSQEDEHGADDDFDIDWSADAADQADRFYRLACDAEEAKATAEMARRAAESAFGEERTARIELMLDIAERDGRITPAERPMWAERLDEDFSVNAPALANEACKLPQGRHTETRANGETRSAIRRRFINAVNERVAATGESFSAAWSNTRRHMPELYQQMQSTR